MSIAFFIVFYLLTTIYAHVSVPQSYQPHANRSGLPSQSQFDQHSVKHTSIKHQHPNCPSLLFGFTTQFIFPSFSNHIQADLQDFHDILPLVFFIKHFNFISQLIYLLSSHSFTQRRRPHQKIHCKIIIQRIFFIFELTYTVFYMNFKIIIYILSPYIKHIYFFRI